MLNKIKYIFITALPILLAGCGFHLKQPPHIPKLLKSISIQSQHQNTPYLRQLRDLFYSHNIALSNSNINSKPQLIIQKLSHQTHLISLSGGAEAGVYQLSGSVTFKLIKNKNTILPSTTIHITQNYTSNATQVLSSENRVQNLWINIQSNLAQRTFNQLTQIKLNFYKYYDS